MFDVEDHEYLSRKFEPILRELTRQELLVLNRIIVDRIRLLNKASSLLHLERFHVGDQVAWIGRGGIEYTGVIIRLNSKTVSIKADEEGYWKVPPEMLRKA